MARATRRRRRSSLGDNGSTRISSCTWFAPATLRTILSISDFLHHFAPGLCLPASSLWCLRTGHKVTAATGACHERSTECYRPYAPPHQCMAGSTAIVTLLLLNLPCTDVEERTGD